MAQMEDVCNVVRSCLLTSNRGTTIDKLHKDYKLLEDRCIPYQSMGFRTLEAFVEQIPGVRMTKKGSELWVEAIPTRESAHIARLVAGQRQPSSRRRRPQRFRQVAPTRRPQAMNRGMRGYDQPRNRSGNYGPSSNRGMSNNMAPVPLLTNQAPRPLVFQPPRQPLMSLPVSPPRPRYTGATNIQASPSKRMLERNIQPLQHLDYERNCRPAARVSSPASSKTTGELVRPIKNQQPPEPEAPPTPITPSSVVSRTAASINTRMGAVGVAPPLIEPVTNAPVANAPVTNSWPTQQPLARTRLCDRLIISQTQSLQNSTVTNGNNGIKVTFKNIGAGGDGPLTPVSPTEDPRDELKKLLENLNLQNPIYKIRPVVRKNGIESGFYGQVSIGSLTKYSSYPEEAKTEKEAEILAARQALIELKKEHGSKFLLRQTSDKTLIKRRVLAIVDQHNGVFTHKIPSYYQELYNENLPENWMEDIQKWTEMEMDQGVDKSRILRRRASSNDKIPSLPSPKSDKVLLSPMGPVEPGKLVLPDEHFWIAYVTSVVSSVEIWVRLVGEDYSEQFDKLSLDMIQHYKTAKYPVTQTVEVGGYYAMKDETYWHRVRVIEFDEAEDTAEIFFIDSGDEDTVSTSMLVPLSIEFCLLPAQAIKVSLAGLEDFADCISVRARIEKILLEGIFYVEDLSREITEDGPSPTAVFYDTNGPEDVNVNELISRKIRQQLISNVPKLEVEGYVTDVHISYVDDNGDVFLQVKNEGRKFLVKMLNRLTQEGLTTEDLRRSAVTTVDRSKVYFVRCPETGNWYRAKVVDGANNPRGLKMFLIDFGRTVVVDTKNVLQLDVLSQFLTEYPAQAMKVRLKNIELSMFDEKMVARLIELAPPSEVLVLKVVTASDRGSPPTVDLFKRIQPDNILVSINNTLALMSQLSQTNGDGNNNVRPRRRVERTNSRVSGGPDEVAKVLKPPKIPGINEYFDVHVTMAANPGNFTVQPHAMMAGLRAMSVQLQQECLAYVGPPLTLDSIKEGRLYAAKHIDGDWYRARVSNVINEHMITVYFCDYGDVTVVTLDKLQRLQTKFLDLPYLAIKARLVGIQPTNMDWAVEDAVRFQDLVVERDFVSVLVESTPDKHSPGETVLGLKLIDVSTDDDIYIGKLLVDEGRAIYTD